jgi:hypothetical protein
MEDQVTQVVHQASRVVLLTLAAHRVDITLEDMDRPALVHRSLAVLLEAGMGSLLHHMARPVSLLTVALPVHLASQICPTSLHIPVRLSTDILDKDLQAMVVHNPHTEVVVEAGN